MAGRLVVTIATFTVALVSLVEASAVKRPEETATCASGEGSPCRGSARSASLLQVQQKRGRNDEIQVDSTLLKKSHFAHGTVIIDAPGLYTLEEDVTFNPTTPLMAGISNADSHFPDPTSEVYPQTGGFFLGFFATIAVVADNVTIDCRGFTIKMHEAFHRRQRFHSLIELGSKPFISGAGPPQMSNSLLTRSEIRTPNNVFIRNCKLGLSSHHGIHGNNNQGVRVQNVQVQDFEVAGIHLNGASNVHIEDVEIGPSLKKTFNARLSQVVFLDHLMNTLLPTAPHMNVFRDTVEITLRGEQRTISSIFSSLHNALHTFLQTQDGPLRSTVGAGDALPDGSAVYGLVIHTTGPAVADFGACPFLKAQKEDRMVSGVTLKNIDIHDLAVDVDQITRLTLGGKQVMGPAGDVFNWRFNTDSEDAYVGNLLSDAQLAVGAFKKFLTGLDEIDEETMQWYFGGVHVPDEILSWAASLASWTGPRDFKCDGDAMSHMNKGAVGLFLSNLADGSFDGVQVSGVSNFGNVDAHGARCVYTGSSNHDRYHGVDTKGVAIVNSPAVGPEGIRVDEGSLHSAHGTVESISIMNT